MNNRRGFFCYMSFGGENRAYFAYKLMLGSRFLLGSLMAVGFILIYLMVWSPFSVKMGICCKKRVSLERANNKGDYHGCKEDCC